MPRTASALELRVIGGGAILLGDVQNGQFVRAAARTATVEGEKLQRASAELNIVQTSVDAEMADTGATSTTEITAPTKDMTTAAGGFGLSPTYIRSTSTHGTYIRDSAGNVTQVSYP